MYVCTGPANIFGDRTPYKNSADLHPGQFTSKEHFSTDLQNLSSLHKIGWRSAEKITPFFNNAFFVSPKAVRHRKYFLRLVWFFKHASSSRAPRISMDNTLLLCNG
jgi:hypothetical protein